MIAIEILILMGSGFLALGEGGHGGGGGDTVSFDLAGFFTNADHGSVARTNVENITDYFGNAIVRQSDCFEGFARSLEEDPDRYAAGVEMEFAENCGLRSVDALSEAGGNLEEISEAIGDINAHLREQDFRRYAVRELKAQFLQTPLSSESRRGISRPSVGYEHLGCMQGVFSESGNRGAYNFENGSLYDQNISLSGGSDVFPDSCQATLVREDSMSAVYNIILELRERRASLQSKQCGGRLCSELHGEILACAIAPVSSGTSNCEAHDVGLDSVSNFSDPDQDNYSEYNNFLAELEVLEAGKAAVIMEHPALGSQPNGETAIDSLVSAPSITESQIATINRNFREGQAQSTWSMLEKLACGTEAQQRETANLMIATGSPVWGSYTDNVQGVHNGFLPEDFGADLACSMEVGALGSSWDSAQDDFLEGARAKCAIGATTAIAATILAAPTIGLAGFANPIVNSTTGLYLDERSRRNAQFTSGSIEAMARRGGEVSGCNPEIVVPKTADDYRNFMSDLEGRLLVAGIPVLMELTMLKYDIIGHFAGNHAVHAATAAAGAGLTGALGAFETLHACQDWHSDQAYRSNPILAALPTRSGRAILGLR